MNAKKSHKRETKGITGVWHVRELIGRGSSKPLSDKPFPNLFIFTAKHYSMVWVSGTDAQRPFTTRWSPTDAEKMERFDSLVVNAGMYEIENNTLIAHPVVARIPDFMGGKLICEYHIENDKMLLKFVDEYSFDGVQAPWVAEGGLILTLVRVE